jgi:hypothetical protein
VERSRWSGEKTDEDEMLGMPQCLVAANRQTNQRGRTLLLRLNEGPLMATAGQPASIGLEPRLMARCEQ